PPRRLTHRAPLAGPGDVGDHVPHRLRSDVDVDGFGVRKVPLPVAARHVSGPFSYVDECAGFSSCVPTRAWARTNIACGGGPRQSYRSSSRSEQAIVLHTVIRSRVWPSDSSCVVPLSLPVTHALHRPRSHPVG